MLVGTAPGLTSFEWAEAACADHSQMATVAIDVRYCRHQHGEHTSMSSVGEEQRIVGEERPA